MGPPTPDELGGTISRSLYTTLVYWRMNKTRESCFAAVRANSCEVLEQAGGCPSLSLFHIRLTLIVLSCITGMTWSGSQPETIRASTKMDQDPSLSHHLEWEAQWVAISTPPPSPTQRPMCSGLRAKPQRQASSMAQLAWPRSAGFAIIILGHLFYVGDGVDIRQLLIQGRRTPAGWANRSRSG